MLLNQSKPKYQTNDIISLKLVNGDEIVATYLGETDAGFNLERPMTVLPTQQGINLMPALFTSTTEKFQLDFIHVMLTGEAAEQMRAFYITKTSGIQTIPKQKIIV